MIEHQKQRLFGITVTPENVLDVLEYEQVIIEWQGYLDTEPKCLALFPHPYIGAWMPSRDSWAIAQKALKDYNERRRPEKPPITLDEMWQKKKTTLKGIVAIVWARKQNEAELVIDKKIAISHFSRPIMMPPHRAITKNIWVLSQEKSDTLRRYGAT